MKQKETDQKVTAKQSWLNKSRPHFWSMTIGQTGIHNKNHKVTAAIRIFVQIWTKIDRKTVSVQHNVQVQNALISDIFQFVE